MVQKIYSKMHPVYNTHYDVTDLVSHGMVKNTKIWISWEKNVTFLNSWSVPQMTQFEKSLFCIGGNLQDLASYKHMISINLIYFCNKDTSA